MKNNNLMYLVLGGIILIGVMGVFAIDKKNNNPNANISAESIYSESSLDVIKNNFDFGTILMGAGVVSNKFEIFNNGEYAVSIGKVYTSCSCTTAYLIIESGRKIGKFGMSGHKGLQTNADIEILPNESLAVEVIYDPAFHGPAGVGLAQRSVYIETNSIKSPKLELKFQAMVVR